jgi:hypothetical protein
MYIYNIKVMGVSPSADIHAINRSSNADIVLYPAGETETALVMTQGESWPVVPSGYIQVSDGTRIYPHRLEMGTSITVGDLWFQRHTNGDLIIKDKAIGVI